MFQNDQAFPRQRLARAVFLLVEQGRYCTIVNKIAELVRKNQFLRTNLTLHALLYSTTILFIRVEDWERESTQYNTIHQIPVFELYPTAQVADMLQHKQQVQVA